MSWKTYRRICRRGDRRDACPADLGHQIAAFHEGDRRRYLCGGGRICSLQICSHRAGAGHPREDGVGGSARRRSRSCRARDAGGPGPDYVMAGRDGGCGVEVGSPSLMSPSKRDRVDDGVVGCEEHVGLMLCEYVVRVALWYGWLYLDMVADMLLVGVQPYLGAVVVGVQPCLVAVVEEEAHRLCRLFVNGDYRACYLGSRGSRAGCLHQAPISVCRSRSCRSDKWGQLNRRLAVHDYGELYTETYVDTPSEVVAAGLVNDRVCPCRYR